METTTFGTWLKRQRKSKHLTQAELARQIACATVTIRKIEADERHPSRQLAELLAREFGVLARHHQAFLEYAQEGCSPETLFLKAEAATEPPTLLHPEQLSAARLSLHLPVRASYLLDVSNERLLLEVQGAQRLPIASLTKILTALIALEQGHLQQCMHVRQETLDLLRKHHAHTAGLKVDDQIALKDLLYALMLPSGNDAAFVIAESIAGSAQAFVRLMNEYCQRLKLENTRYVNPSGTPYFNLLEECETSNYSTAADLVRLTQHALTNPLFAQIVQLQRYELPLSALHHSYIWESNNRLLYSYAGATGVKTGYARDAQSCLIFSATRGAQQLLGAVMGANELQQRFSTARTLLDWGFAKL